MKAYLTYFKLKFITGLQYRPAALGGISTQFFFGFVYVMIYDAFYLSGGSTPPMKFTELICYLWLNQIFYALVNQFYRDQELFQIIREGTIAYELTRPKNLYFMWYFKTLGERLASVTLRSIPLIVVTFLLSAPYNMTLPLSIEYAILFIISITLGTLLMASLSVLYPIIMLKTLNEKGVVNIFVVIADILSGVVIPIPFFPIFLQVISKYLPFQYISDLPFRIYTGNINISNGIIGIIIQIIWIITIIIIGNYLMKKNLKRIEVQGG